MLTLARMNGGSIYSLSANGGESRGTWASGPNLDAARYRTTAADRSSVVSGATGRPVSSGRPLVLLCDGGVGRPEAPDFR